MQSGQFKPKILNKKGSVPTTGQSNRSMLNIYSKWKQNPNLVMNTTNISNINIDSSFMINKFNVPKLYPKQLLDYSNQDLIDKTYPRGPHSKEEYKEFIKKQRECVTRLKAAPCMKQDRNYHDYMNSVLSTGEDNESVTSTRDPGRKLDQIQIITGFSDNSQLPVIGTRFEDFMRKTDYSKVSQKKIVPMKDKLNKTINKTFLQMSIMQSNITKSSIDRNTPKKQNETDVNLHRGEYDNILSAQTRVTTEQAEKA